MPDVKLMASQGVLPAVYSTGTYQHDLYAQSITEMKVFCQRVRQAVAAHLSVEAFRVEPEHVDLHMFRSGSDGYVMAGSENGKQIVMEVAGYAYQERMTYIGERMRSIAIDVNLALQEIGREMVYISYSFFPVREDCWGSVSPR